MILWSFVFEKLLIHLRSFFFKQLFEKWVVIKIKIKKRKKIYKDKGDAREKQNKTKQNKNKQIEMWEKIDSYKDKGNCERK